MDSSAFFIPGQYSSIVWCLCCLVCISPLQAEKLVPISAKADPAYVKRRAESDPPKIETYVFAKGQYSGGTTHDSSLEKKDFYSIATMLASDLRKQRYEPAKSLKTADLVIVVHWGVTLSNDKGASLFLPDANVLNDRLQNIRDAQDERDAQDAAGGESTSRALGTVEAAEAAFNAEGQMMSSVYSFSNNLIASTNADLLGFTSTLNAEDDSLFPTTTAYTLKSMIDEERYFIILMAYDANALRAGQKKRLWITRMSIRSAGVNFTMAVDRMSGVAANFYGTRQNSIAMGESKDRKGTVKIGELKIIGDTPEPSRTGP